MKTFLIALCVVVAAGVFGCDKKSSPTAPSPVPKTTTVPPTPTPPPETKIVCSGCPLPPVTTDTPTVRNTKKNTKNTDLEILTLTPTNVDLEPNAELELKAEEELVVVQAKSVINGRYYGADHTVNSFLSLDVRSAGIPSAGGIRVHGELHGGTQLGLWSSSTDDELTLRMEVNSG